MVQEGCPFIPALLLEPGPVRPVEPPQHAAEPRRRRHAGAAARRATWTPRTPPTRPGSSSAGDIDIPIIDWRHYLEDELDMHNSHQSFASRQRMLNFDGDASNQVIWFTDARPARAFDQTPHGVRGDGRVAGEHPREPGAAACAGNKPAAAVDSCFATDGSLTLRGRRRLGRHPRLGRRRGRARRRSRCSRPRASSRAARSRAASSSARCKPVGDGDRRRDVRAVAAEARPTWRGSQQIFPTGVCDYSRPDVGRPPGF